MRKYWFFDFDGTLCDTEEDIKNAWKASIKALGRECPQFDEIFKIGPTLEQIGYKLFEDCTPELIEQIKDLFKGFYDESDFTNTKPYPWVPGWIDDLKAQGCKLYIATNKRWRPMKKLVPHLGWDRVFDGYYSFDMLTEEQEELVVPEFMGQKLTKAQLLKEIMKKHDIGADASVMVGDTIGDINAGIEAGMRTIGCTWGYGEAKELEGADEIYDMGRFSK